MNRTRGMVGLRLCRFGLLIKLSRCGYSPVVMWLGTGKFGEVRCGGVLIRGADATFRDRSKPKDRADLRVILAGSLSIASCFFERLLVTVPNFPIDEAQMS